MFPKPKLITKQLNVPLRARSQRNNMKDDFDTSDLQWIDSPLSATGPWTSSPLYQAPPAQAKPRTKAGAACMEELLGPPPSEVPPPIPTAKPFGGQRPVDTRSSKAKRNAKRKERRKRMKRAQAQAKKASSNLTTPIPNSQSDEAKAVGEATAKSN